MVVFDKMVDEGTLKLVLLVAFVELIVDIVVFKGVIIVEEVESDVDEFMVNVVELESVVEELVELEPNVLELELGFEDVDGISFVVVLMLLRNVDVDTIVRQ